MDGLREIIDRLPAPTRHTGSSGKASIFSLTDESPKAVTCGKCGQTMIYTGLGRFGGMWLFTRPECSCEQAAERELERQQKRERTRRIREGASGMSKEQLAYRLSGLQAKPRPKKTPNGISISSAVSKSWKWLREYPSAPWLILSGAYGCGKTHMTCGIANELIARLVDVRFANLPRLIAEIPKSWEKDGGTPDPIPKLIGCQVLALDEIREDRCFLDESSWQSRELYRLINGRYEANRPTIFTTNLRSPEKLMDAVGERVFDRIIHHAEWWDIDAPSHRADAFMARQRG